MGAARLMAKLFHQVRAAGWQSIQGRERGALDDVQARLDKIEHERSARQPLKAIGG